MHSRKQGLLAAVATVALGLLAACGGSTPTSGTSAGESASPELQALIDAAKKEGEVVLYSNLSETATKALSEDFQEYYGIATQYVRLSAASLYPKFSAEQAAKQYVVDVLVAEGDDGFIESNLEAGLLSPVSTAGIPGIPPAGVDMTVYNDVEHPTIAGTVRGICYNSELVKGDDIPKAWDDLLDPKWTGKIVTPDPWASDAQFTILNTLAQINGIEFVEKLAPQVQRVYPGMAPMLQAVVAGEALLAAPSTLVTAKNLSVKGAPIECTTPDGATAGSETVVLVTNAPHPAAAKLLTHYLISKRAGEIVTQNGGIVSPWGTGELGIPHGYKQYPTATEPERVALLDAYASVKK